MSMKTADSPRRVYSTKGTLALCHKGVLYGFPATEDATSAFRKDVPAVVVAENEDGSVTVRQRKPHAKSVEETWLPL